MTIVSQESRSALSRAKFFLDQAEQASPESRVFFEANLEASIVFARAAMHRFKTKHGGHKDFKKWWDSLRTDSTVNFFRGERDFILKEAPPKLGQKISMPAIDSAGGSVPAPQFKNAAECYYYEDPSIPATTTVSTHLQTLEQLLEAAEQQFK